MWKGKCLPLASARGELQPVVDCWQAKPTAANISGQSCSTVPKCSDDWVQPKSDPITHLSTRSDEEALALYLFNILCPRPAQHGALLSLGWSPHCQCHPFLASHASGHQTNGCRCSHKSWKCLGCSQPCHRASGCCSGGEVAAVVNMMIYSSVSSFTCYRDVFTKR